MTQPESSRPTSPLAAHVRTAEIRRDNRRGFFAKSSIAIAGGAVLATEQTIARAAHALGDDTIRVGLIGCGARGRAAAVEVLQTNSVLNSGRVQLVAMADTRTHQLQSAYRSINSRQGSWVDVGERRFVGRTSWEPLLATNVDLVILATPPACRPDLFVAAVHAGKHVMMESHVAVDARGLDKVQAAANLAAHRGLAVGSGLQRRHELRTRALIDQVQSGAIGRFTLAHGGVADERSLHWLDLLNWATGSAPLFADATAPIADAARFIEFHYPGGLVASTPASCFSSHRAQLDQSQPNRTQASQHDTLEGSRGVCDFQRGLIRDRQGKIVWQSTVKEIPGKGWQAQFNHMIAAIRNGSPFDESAIAIQSTATWLAGVQASKDSRRVDVSTDRTTDVAAV